MTSTIDALKAKQDKQGSEVLINIYEMTLSALSSSDIKKADAERAAEILLEKIMQEFGGISLYIPSGRSLKSAQLQGNIKAEFNGRNADALARKYKISARTVERIIRTDHLERQTDMWGDNEV